MRATLLLTACLAACGSEAERQAVPEPSGPPVVQQAGPGAAEPQAPASGWEASVSGGATTLRLAGPDGRPVLTLGCGGGRLVAQAPGFTRIGSEDRFALGLGEEPVTLVADLGARETGVTASAVAPANLEALLERADRIGASYGQQQIGPLPAPSPALKEQLAEACSPK